MLATPAISSAGVFVSITVAPPALPVYVQPPCPTEGYLWNPGYWAYGPAGYYWVPGVWVAPPRIGVLWTPPYWGYEGGFYAFHPGYWGPHVGFYGGINYGFGYGGFGYVGGGWRGNRFAYNTAVTQVNTTIVHNTYVNKTVIVNNTVNNVNRTSFNGPGGIAAKPTAQEVAVAHEQHIPPTPNQLSHERAAGADHNQFASVNHGRPGTLVAARPMAAPAQAQARLNSRPPNAAGPAANARPANPVAGQQRGLMQQPQARPATQPHPYPQAQQHPQAQQRMQARPAAPQQQHPQQRAEHPQQRAEQHPPQRPPVQHER